MSCTLETSTFCDCDMLHRGWQGVYRSPLKRSMSLASTKPRCCVQGQQLDQWHCCSQIVEMTDKHESQCMSVQLVADMMNRLLKKTKCCDCEIMHWAWQGVSRSSLKRAMSLASTNPHAMLPAETTPGPVALPLGEQPSCGNDRQLWNSMHVSPADCTCDEQF
jgi:hypothetical protein